MKTNEEILKEVKEELTRFTKKINLALKEQKGEDNYSSKHFAASKRAAMDLKNELTKLTQSSKYKWDN